MRLSIASPSLTLTLCLVALLSARLVEAQTSRTGMDSSITEQQEQLSQRLTQVLAALDGMQKQLSDSQQQIEELRQELKVAESKLDQNGQAPGDQSAATLRESVRQLKDDDELVQTQVKQLDQSKVETASKYPLRVSGMFLFSSFLNDGAVDDIDLPMVAMARNDTTAHGSLAATARQTALGLNALGPHLWGARSSADLSLDFFGGMASSRYSASDGLLRLRTAHASLEWPNRSLRFEVDKPLIAPLEPTSLLSFAEPAMAWSGNLWVWSPQLVFSTQTELGAGALALHAGLIDTVSPTYASTTGLRQPNPAEQSRTPGFETQLDYTFNYLGHPLQLGAGGYYSRKKYFYGESVDAWAASADFRLPLWKPLELSGAFYRGRALQGLGGAFQDYVLNPQTGLVRGLDAEGGWSQLKWRISRSLEANGAIGQAAGSGDQLQYDYPMETGTYTNLARNRNVVGNMIFRPNSYLIFSAEYRNLRSWPITGAAYASQSFGLGAGYLF